MLFRSCDGGRDGEIRLPQDGVFHVIAKQAGAQPVLAPVFFGGQLEGARDFRAQVGVAGDDAAARFGAVEKLVHAGKARAAPETGAQQQIVGRRPGQRELGTDGVQAATNKNLLRSGRPGKVLEAVAGAERFQPQAGRQQPVGRHAPGILAVDGGNGGFARVALIQNPKNIIGYQNLPTPRN